MGVLKTNKVVLTLNLETKTGKVTMQMKHAMGKLVVRYGCS